MYEKVWFYMLDLKLPQRKGEKTDGSKEASVEY